MPGLSAMKSLPCRMTSMPSGARSFGIAALTTSWMLGSSRISCSLRASFASGYRFANAAARSGSFAKKDDELAAAALDGVDLAVDVAVVEADGGEPDARRPRGGGGAAPRALPPYWPTPARPRPPATN